MSVTVLYGRRATRHRHVLAMITVMNIPSSRTELRTVRYRCLVANTGHIVQQDRTGPWPVLITNYRSFVSEIQATQSIRSTVDLAAATSLQAIGGVPPK